MHWTLLFLAAALEIVWAAGLKFTDGFTRLWPSLGVGAAMAASMTLLALAARGLPIGTAYAFTSSTKAPPPPASPASRSSSPA